MVADGVLLDFEQGFGGPGPDTLFGGPLGDFIGGNGGGDPVSGGRGNDRVVGGIGNDQLNGAAATTFCLAATSTQTARSWQTPATTPSTAATAMTGCGER